MGLRKTQISVSHLALRATLGSAAIVCSCGSEVQFECPDQQTMDLLELAVSIPLPSDDFATRVSSYTQVIQDASRPMDEVPLSIACRNFARTAYEYAHPEAGKTLSFGLVPPRSATSALLRDYPILERCPSGSLYDSYFPTLRTPYDPSVEALRNNVTGWVDLALDLNESGAVDSAAITASSDPILETGIIDHVLTFRYPSAQNPMYSDMPRKGLTLRVTTSYFDIARAKGCVWRDPRE